MKSYIKTLFVLTVLVLLCSGCGNSKQTAMGRYVEEQVTLPDSRGNYTALVQGQQNLRLIASYGGDMVCMNDGEVFEKAELPSAAVESQNASYASSCEAGTPDGSRILAEYPEGVQRYKLVTADGREILLENINEGEYPHFYYGADYFYMCKGYEIYQIDPSTGEMLFLTESAFYPLYLTADEDRLFVVHSSGVLLYDLQNKKVAEKQDETLSSLLAGKLELENSVTEGSPLLLYPCRTRSSSESHSSGGDEILLLIRSGIYSYKLYGGEPECILDGGMYSISDVDKEFAGMAVTEGESGRIFYILYSDGKLMRYVMDETLPSEPECCLRVYSLYEDGNIRQAVSAFRKKYPELSIRYEVGVQPGYGMTEEDALRNLSTELSAGTGPDILVMDDLPIGSYAEKGVLEDLTFLRETMPEEEYFLPVIDGFASEAGQYVMPLTFAVPVLAGDEEKIQAMGETESLSQLAQELEKAAGGQEGSVIGIRSPEETLRLFAQSSMGAWMTEDGTLDRAAVEDFLTQVKRIYDLQRENSKYWIYGMDWGKWGSGENVLGRKHGSYGLTEALSVKFVYSPEQPFYAGYLSSAQADYPLTQGQLEHAGGSYRMMPGQNYGTCLPATLMAMNNASSNQESSRLFLTYIFSKEFQGSVALNGTPVNKSAYQKRQANPYGDSTRTYMHYGYGAPDGSHVSVKIYWPTAENFAKLSSLFESVSGVNYCDNRIYEAVIEYGQRALTGEIGIKEAVDEMEEELELYLAE